MSGATTPEGPRDWRDKGLDWYDQRHQNRLNPNSGQPPLTPMTRVEQDLSGLKSRANWILVLLIVNLLLTAYVADFVHQLVQAVNSI